MNQVNLLPPEILQRERTRRLTGLVALVGAVVILLIVVVWVLESTALSHANDQLAAQEATNAALQAQVNDLQRYADTQAELASKQQLVSEVYKNEISWSGVLGDLSNVVPDSAYLQSMTFQESLSDSASAGAATTGAAATATGTTPGAIGEISFTARAQEVTTVSQMLAQIAQVDGWENPDATGITQTAPRARVYDFQMAIELTDAVLTPRGAGEGGSP